MHHLLHSLTPLFIPKKPLEANLENYPYWRLRIFYSIYFGYTSFYLTRKSLAYIFPALSLDLGLSNQALGTIGALLYTVYGISKFFNGILSDRSNPRYFLPLGLFLTGICNICFGLSSHFGLFLLFWGLNGWFQGWGWPPIVRLLTHWYSKTERGRWWGVWNTSHNLGAGITPLLLPYLALVFNWRLSMIFTGGFCAFFSLYLMNRLRDTPHSIGLPSIEEYRQESFLANSEEDRPLSTKEIFFKYVLQNRYLWLLSLAYFFIYAIRTAISDWGYMYFMQEKGWSQLGSGLFLSSFEIGGFFGSLCAGWISDELFQGRRIIVNTLFSCGILLAFLCLLFFPIEHPLFYTILMGMCGFFIFGPQMLIGVACAELSHKNASGTATGFAGVFAYAGAAFSVYFCGLFSDTWGWSHFFPLLALFALIPILLLGPICSVEKRSEPRSF